MPSMMATIATVPWPPRSPPDRATSRTSFVPLLASSDQQVGLKTYRLWPDISLDSVGPDGRKEVASWPEDVRADFIGDCCTTADLASLASADASPKVKMAAASGLSWRRAEEGSRACWRAWSFALRCRPKRRATLRSIRACRGCLANFRGDSTPTLISPSGFIHDRTTQRCRGMLFGKARLPRRRLHERVIGCRENCSRFARLAALAWVLRPLTGSPEQAS